MITQLNIEGISDELLKLGAHFYKEANLPGNFIPEVFTNTWQTLMRTGMGAIWVCHHEGQPVGAIGGVIYPDANDGSLVAQEMFWFMDPESRGGLDAIRLYKALETWASERGAARLTMGCILGKYARALGAFYTNKGFRPVDVSYFKNL